MSQMCKILGFPIEQKEHKAVVIMLHHQVKQHAYTICKSVWALTSWRVSVPKVKL